MMAYAICTNFMTEGRDLIKCNDNKSAKDIQKIVNTLKIKDKDQDDDDLSKIGFFKIEN